MIMLAFANTVAIIEATRNPGQYERYPVLPGWVPMTQSIIGRVDFDSPILDMNLRAQLQSALLQALGMSA